MQVQQRRQRTVTRKDVLVRDTFVQTPLHTFVQSTAPGTSGRRSARVQNHAAAVNKCVRDLSLDKPRMVAGRVMALAQRHKHVTRSVAMEKVGETYANGDLFVHS